MSKDEDATAPLPDVEAGSSATYKQTKAFLDYTPVRVESTRSPTSFCDPYSTTEEEPSVPRTRPGQRVDRVHNTQ